MGCDIHMCVEYKRSPEDSWRSGDYFHKDDPLSPDATMCRVDLYDDRCYSLFAVLAGVRNNGDYKPIDTPRGLPDDVTEYVKKDYKSWGIDAHSCSFLTLRELKEWDDQNKPTNIFGGRILEPLINRLIMRADELCVVWSFEWDNAGADTYKDAERIRIVFWFDN